MGEGGLAELADGVGLIGGEDEVVGFVVLEDAPHALDVLLGVAPVALGVEVAEEEVLLEAALDAGDGASDLAGDEGLAAAGALVVEEDAVAGMEVVAFAVIDGGPVGEDLGDGIGAAGPEG